MPPDTAEELVVDIDAADPGQRVIAARHPGVTDRRDAGRPLSELMPLSSRQVVRLGAAVATTLADLHDLGIVHGAVSADHIVIDPDGRALLCGLGPAGSLGPAGDVAALAQTLDRALSPAGTSRALRGVLARAADADPRRRQTARRLAQLLADRAADPAQDPPPERVPPRPPTGPATVASAVAVAGLVPLALLGCLLLTRSSSHRSPAAVTIGSGRYVIGDASDRVVMGRWRCQGRLAALLRPTTGEVWVFDTWAAPGRRVTARRVTRVAGAGSMRVDEPPARGTGPGATGW